MIGGCGLLPCLRQQRKSDTVADHDPVLLVSGIGGSILNSKDKKSGSEIRVWVRILLANLEFKKRACLIFGLHWSRLDKPPLNHPLSGGGFRPMRAGGYSTTSGGPLVGLLQVRLLFEEHGDVIEVALIKDKKTGQQQVIQVLLLGVLMLQDQFMK